MDSEAGPNSDGKALDDVTAILQLVDSDPTKYWVAEFGLSAFDSPLTWLLFRMGLFGIMFLVLIWSVAREVTDFGVWSVYLTNWTLVLQNFYLLSALLSTMHAARVVELHQLAYQISNGDRLNTAPPLPEVPTISLTSPSAAAETQTRSRKRERTLPNATAQTRSGEQERTLATAPAQIKNSKQGKSPPTVQEVYLLPSAAELSQAGAVKTPALSSRSSDRPEQQQRTLTPDTDTKVRTKNSQQSRGSDGAVARSNNDRDMENKSISRQVTTSQSPGQPGTQVAVTTAATSQTAGQPVRQTAIDTTGPNNNAALKKALNGR